MEWVLVERYKKYNVWLNTKYGYKESFWKKENPNKMDKSKTN